MHKVWISSASSNFLQGRAGFAPEAIVVHRAGNSLSVIDRRYKLANQFCSSHYAVGMDGEVHQYTEERDTAFHAGVVVGATWKLLKNGKNPNLYTIAVELAASPGNSQDSTPSDEQESATAELVAEIAARWNIPIDADHIVLHSEIRAGTRCPNGGFDRNRLLRLVAAGQRPRPAGGSTFGEVTVLKTANVRQIPNSTSRIVRVALAQASESVTGFEDQGERINGNSCWYLTSDGYYLWAGVTDNPNPVSPVTKLATGKPMVATASNLPSRCNIPALDRLLDGGNAPPVDSNSESAAVGAIQDLLAGHALRGLPSVVSGQYGRWNRATTIAVQVFQKDNGLQAAANVNLPTLRALLDVAAVDPRASEVYLALVLGVAPGELTKVLTLVSQMEGAGKFGAISRNSDRSGLSFGLIQWAQKPGRLVDVMVAMRAADQNLFVSIFGAGDPALAADLVSYCRKPSGGVDPKTGTAVNPAFNLIEDPWLTRFRRSALEKTFQQTQVQVALQAFDQSYSRIRQFAPDVVSERGIAFMLDVANQFGDGGVHKLYNDVRRSGMTEADLLEAIAEETVVHVDDSLKAGVRSRREQFLQTPQLSNLAFDVAPAVQPTMALANA